MHIKLDKKSLFRLFIIVSTSLVPLTINAVQTHSLPTNNAINAQQQYEAIRAIRDPFTPSSLMFDTILIKGSASGAAGYGFMRSPSKANLPTMRLRGYTNKNNKPVALLEVDDDRTYLIHEGDEINIDPATPNSAIRITKITRFSVTVEAGMLGSIKVQR
ncbi:MAG: hypothetical protein JKX67_02355 [Colwellia sp.]|nr:hypothetical protein [Colwellia sp.]